MKKNLLIALLLSVFMSLSNVMPLNVLAKETTQVDVENSVQHEVIRKEDGKYAVNLSGKGLTNAEQLWNVISNLEKLNNFKTDDITDLNISNNNLSGSLNFTDFGGLLFLDCSNNEIEALNADCTTLLRINCSHNKMKSFIAPTSVLFTNKEILTINTFVKNIFEVENDFSNQNVNIQAKKGATVIPFYENFPQNDPARMILMEGAEKSKNTDQIINISGNQFSYKYQTMDDSVLNTLALLKQYSLDVTVHVEREGESSSIDNGPINIANDVANGLVGKQDSSDTESIHRLYNPNSGEHFYTSDTKERDHLVNIGWRNEGIGWVAPKISMAPVYRLYNPNAGDHHYTLDANERNDLQKYGWRYEGISFYSDEYHTVPLYRQYNPNAISGAHNFTTDKYENDYLISVGWRAEKIGWYALSKQ